MIKKTNLIRVLLITLTTLLIMLTCGCSAQNVPFPSIDVNVQTADNPEEVAVSIQVLILLTILSLAPSILIMMTSFTRIIIVLSFLRNALGTQQMPPNQVLIGLALFLTFFIMTPVLQDINENAYQPYISGEISYNTALETATTGIKQFMLKQIRDNKRDKDLAFFINLSKIDTPKGMEGLLDLPLSIIIPAFIIGEMTVAFKIGFLIYIPFLVIDMVIASTLMSMGMMMLPPVMISLPFKILLFIMVDGWNLITQSIVGSFG